MTMRATRPTASDLPPGYQFCDAVRDRQQIAIERFDAVILAINQGWRPWHETAAEQLARTADRLKDTK